MLIIPHLNLCAFDFVLGHGGVTTHYTNVDKNLFYCNELKDTGTIYNQSQYVGIEGQNYGVYIMQGEDSICSPIGGGLLTYHPYNAGWWRFGMVVGFYNFKKDIWDRRPKFTPTGSSSPEPVYARIGHQTFVPVVALSIPIKLYNWGRMSLWLNNFASIYITNHSLALHFKF